MAHCIAEDFLDLNPTTGGGSGGGVYSRGPGIQVVLTGHSDRTSGNQFGDKGMCVSECVCVHVDMSHMSRVHTFVCFCTHTFDVGSLRSGCAHLFSGCVRVTLVAISVSDGQQHTQDMTADWQTGHQHSSQQSQRTLSGCQGHFMQDIGLIKIWNLFGGQMCS